MRENPPPAGMAPDDNPEREEPIASLRDLEQDTSPLFFHNILSKIHRHATAAQLLEFSWQMPPIVFSELQSILREVLSGLGNKTGE